MITITEVLESVQYIIDDHRRKTAVQFDLSGWEALLPLIEEVLKDGRLAELIADVADDERLEESEAQKAYQTYLAEA
ncbi:hypothetical protein MNBD_CHLOROFLEXI01-1394 [hydrothermal vent metagenome]|uniref:Uncharacterized protein n=1 Tax=hydrothermal vent metagenome TaxID=652676 RepID=A0A3B0V745_9ZZZZ